MHTRDFILKLFTLPDQKDTIFGEVAADMLQNDFIAVILANFPLAFLASFLLFQILQPHITYWINLFIVFCFTFNIHMLALINKYDYSLMEVVIILLLSFLFLKYQEQNKSWILIVLGVCLGVSS